MSNPYCVDSRHAFYIGCVAGIAVRNGLRVEFVDDEDGVHTDRLLMHIAPGVDVTFIVPPPPDDWTLEGWMSCTCPRINVGSKVTEHRNLSPHCPVHGAEHDRQADILFGGGA